MLWAGVLWDILSFYDFLHSFVLAVNPSMYIAKLDGSGRKIRQANTGLYLQNFRYARLREKVGVRARDFLL